MKAKGIKLIFLIIIFFGLFGLAQSSEAKVINVVNTSGQPSCEQVDVQRVINDTGTADGDTVFVPAGNCAWTSLTTVTKGIIIIGAGTSSTIITDSYNGNIIKMNVDTGKSWRISGIKFTASLGDFNGVVNVSGGSTSWRIDNCRFEDLGKSFGISITATGYGVIDHNLFLNTTTAPFTAVYVKGGSTIGERDQQWADASSIGTANAIYIEDNTFTHQGNPQAATVDCEAGGRFVFRNNISTNWSPHVHGTGTDNWGCRQWEIYNNTLSIESGKNIARGLFLRGGTGLLFSNKFLGPGTYSTYVAVTDYRTCCGFSGSTCTADKRCDGDCVSCLYNGHGDNNDGYMGYLCFHQIGAGQNNTSDPVYEWLNCSGDSDCSGDNINLNIANISGCSNPSIADHIQNNRDYYAASTGTIAARPASCTPYQGYWATDESKLYKCTATDTWTLAYTPYTYPHPLTLGDDTTPPSAPTGVVVE